MVLRLNGTRTLFATDKEGIEKTVNDFEGTEQKQSRDSLVQYYLDCKEHVLFR